jgi:histidinol dehydrogenase
MKVLRGDSAEGQRWITKTVNRGSTSLAKVEKPVQRIIAQVRKKGDTALKAFALKYDGLEKGQSLRVSQQELEAAWNATSTSFREALALAAENIRAFAKLQKPTEFVTEITPGVRIGQAIRPLDSVGCYIPGGRYPLPSTVLMTVIPAQVAGVKRIQVVSPRPAKKTLAAAYMLGVRDVFRVGGAQAIAALAYGTKSVPRVDKIVGPGNLYVTAAKKAVAFDCAIECLAGPTEALIVAGKGDARFIAADLVAQAEHDPEAICAFITWSESLAKSVATEVAGLAKTNSIAATSLKKAGAVLLVDSEAEAFEIANRIAAEHITVESGKSPLVANAGSIFEGDLAAQPLGDYVSGTNHVLPTGGAARFRGGLFVLDFVKVITTQQVSSAGLARIAPAAVTLAQAEGLTGHAAAVKVRCASA